MKHTQTEINRGALGRFLRRAVFSGTVLAAAAAVAVLGDNGVVSLSVTPPLSSVSGQDSSSYCEDSLTPALFPPVTGRNVNQPVTSNSVASCRAYGSCTNKGLVLNFDINWCCPKGQSCRVRAATGWLSFARWIPFHVAGCAIDTGCK